MFCCLYPLLSFSSILPLAAGARLADFECVCQTVRILGQEIVGNWSPLASAESGGGKEDLARDGNFLLHSLLTRQLDYFDAFLPQVVFVVCQRGSAEWSEAGKGYVSGVRKGEQKQPDSVKAGSLVGPRASGCSPASLACLQQYLRPFFGR